MDTVDTKKKRLAVVSRAVENADLHLEKLGDKTLIAGVIGEKESFSSEKTSLEVELVSLKQKIKDKTLQIVNIADLYRQKLSSLE